MNSISQRLILLPVLCALAGCGGKEKPEPAETDSGPISSVELVALPDRAPAEGPLFIEVPGIDFANRIDKEHPLAFLYVGGFMCGGVAIGDVDGNGRPDLFFVSNDGANRLYLQTEAWKFEDASEAAGIGGGAEAWGAGAAMVDIEGDGDLDIYVCNYDRPNQLFVNDGAARFVERAAEFGLDITDASLMPYFCDYDRDGDLDVYLVCNRYYRPEGAPEGEVYEVVDGEPVLKAEYEKYFKMMQYAEGKLLTLSKGRRDYLLLNESGKFTDVTEKSGIYGEGFGLSASWWDYNGDGYFDLYVANDFETADRLYQNNGDGTFTDIIGSAVSHTSWYSMGSATGDLNNDGRMDLVVVDMAGTSHYKEKINMGEMSGLDQIIASTSEPRQLMRNAVFLNTGVGRMLESAHLSGLATTDWSWAPLLADFDEDMRTDLFVSNGMSRNFMDSDIRRAIGEAPGKTEWETFVDSPPNPEQNFAFRNRDRLRFDDISEGWGLAKVGISMGAAYGDLDGDGDLDLVVANLDEPVSLYRNQSAGSNRIVVELRGDGGNSAAIGARLELAGSDGGQQLRTLHPQSGFLGSHQPITHFGLGEADSVRLKLQWPDGSEEEINGLPANHRIVITKAEGGTPSPLQSTPVSRSFQGGLLAGIPRHKERPFDDFAHQPLLPNKYSQLGPGMAWGDVDDDGADEVYIGGAAGQAGRVYRRNPDFSFSAIPGEYDADADAEDMGALLFDVDGDGDLDLFVASGSYEFEPDSPALHDRLYLNDGGGRFKRAPGGALPPSLTSSGPAAAADFDRDGDLDLFVGGRLTPRQYPVAPPSRLLINDGSGRFHDATLQLAPQLTGAEMVAGALWSDVDGDGWIDLLLATEWGPIRVFANEGGKLVDCTEKAGLAGELGWWNSIDGGDLDGDGDIDYVVGNVGLNTKYKASPDKPVRLYYGDFEGEGRSRLIEAKFENGVLLPIRGKSCSTRAMPFLEKKLPTFDSFASSALTEIYTEQKLAGAQRFEANRLESGVLLNDGSGKFEFVPLPAIAQIAPVFGAVITEVNGDSSPDIFVVGNFFSPQVETGRFDGGISQLLVGRGDGQFDPVEPASSGLIVVGDAAALAITDLDSDRRPDFAITTNNGGTWGYAHAGENKPPVLQVRLHGEEGNLQAIGARVTLHDQSGGQQGAELAAGSGYLSQSSASLYFGLRGIGPRSISVRWPDGSSSEHPYEQRWLAEGARLVKPGASVAAVEPAAGGDITFNEHIAPLVFEHCASCHFDNGPAPFALLNYDQVRRRGKDIVRAAGDRYMPPWLPEEGDVKFADARHLSDQQINLLRRWVEAGAPRGDVGKEPAPPQHVAGWQLGKPDLVLELDEPYQLAADGFDVFRNFVLPVKGVGQRFVRAVEIRPGNPRSVHHAWMTVDSTHSCERLDEADPGPGFGGMQMGNSSPPDGQFAGWTPGKLPHPGYPEMAWRIADGMDIVLQLHMLPRGKPETIRPSVGLYFADEPPKRRPFAIVMKVTKMDIPPGEANYRTRQTFKLPVDVQLLSIYPHAHYVCRDVKASATLPDGKKLTLLSIPDWDFNWQDQYTLETPQLLPAGTEIAMDYIYDNSADNPRNPHSPPRRVIWGDRSFDEMGTLALQVLPANGQDLAALQEAMFKHDVENLGTFRDFYNYGNALQLRGDHAGAIVQYRKSIKLNPEREIVYHNLAGSLAAVQKLDEAITTMGRAIELNPQYADAHLHLGNFLVLKKDLQAALASYQRALEAEPGHAQAKQNLEALKKHFEKAAPDPPAER